MKPGDVVLASLEVSTGRFKQRPVVVLAVIPRHDDLLVCGISSQLHEKVEGLDEVIGMDDLDFRSSRVHRPSLIRAAYLGVKARSAIHGRLGRIDPQRLRRLQSKLADLIQQPVAARVPKLVPRERPEGDLSAFIQDNVRMVDSALDRFIPSAETPPATIHKAVRHSLFAGGKRLRPILCLAAAEACGGSTENTLPAACAVECLHTYSLIHDDLPCMDDDDFRRGVPTCHKVFGEGIAVLAGDALQALAFELVAMTPPNDRFDVRDYVIELAATAGSRHLIGGQVMDLEGEGKMLPLADLRFVHESKTAALLTSAILLGAMSAAASDEQIAALKKFGFATGLAFQIIDDILDCTQTTEKLGKSAGKDLAAAKSTYPALIGLDASRDEARRLTAEAHDALAILGDSGQRLRQLADHLLQREY